MMFVEDQTGGIYCEVSRLANLPPHGHRVEMIGQAVPGSFLPIFSVHELKDLGPGSLPSPRAVRASQLKNGEFDGDFVRLTGYVLEVTHESRSSTATRGAGPGRLRHAISGSARRGQHQT